MIAAGVCKDFGVLAADASIYDTQQSKHTFNSIKLYYANDYLLSFSGTTAYFGSLDKTKFSLGLLPLIVYLEGYLKSEKEKVEKLLKSEIADENDSANFCLFVMGMHKRLPTMVKFNSNVDFKPTYLYSDGDVRFRNDENNKEAQDYMEKKAHKFKKRGIDFSPGIIGEILTRGIYVRSDLETKKVSGGIVNAAALLSSGKLIPLSGNVGV